MIINPTSALVLPGLLLLSDAFTTPFGGGNPILTKARYHHHHHTRPIALASAFHVPPAVATADVPAHVMMAATLDRFDTRMGGLARLLDEMTADPFWATPGPSSLWKRLDMSAPAMAASLKLDVKETNKAYEINADVPGVKKEDIKLSFNDQGTLTIEAERHEEKEETKPAAAAAAEGEGEAAAEGPKYYFKETTFGKVYRSIKLPSNADTAHVDARLADGVLHVSIPKRAPAPSERTIEIK